MNAEADTRATGAPWIKLTRGRVSGLARDRHPTQHNAPGRRSSPRSALCERQHVGDGLGTPHRIGPHLHH